MIKSLIIVVCLFIITSVLSGCAVVAAIPIIGGIGGAASQGYTVWRSFEATRYYAYNVETTYRAVKRSASQLKLKTAASANPPKKGYALETKGDNPLEISVLPAEEKVNVTKVVIKIALLGDRQYAEMFFKTIDENISKKYR
jgi:hypothetical protein